MDLTKEFFEQAEAQRFQVLKSKTSAAIQHALITLNQELRQSGSDVLFSSAENRGTSEFYIQKTNEKDRPLCIASGTGKGMKPDIVIKFSDKEPEITVSSDSAYFQSRLSNGFTHYSNFKYSDEARLTDHLAEKMSALLSESELEILHTRRAVSPLIAQI